MSQKKLGFWTSSSFVVGNMIGAGIFMLPATLASFGPISIFGWLISAVGAMSLSFVFIKFSILIPGKSGGPYTYSREGLGDFGGFLVAWGYWISIWTTNAVLLVTIVSYLGVFLPFLDGNFFLATCTGLVILWIVIWINSQGIREAGVFQLITSILKIIPLLAITLFGLFHINPENFFPLNISEMSNFQAITATATLTFFAYMGLECATVPAANVENPEKTIPRATNFGVIVTTIIYVLCTVVLMGLIPSPILKESTAPFSDAARLLWGPSAEFIVAAGTVIAALGSLNGWSMIQGQIPNKLSEDRLFPSIFSRKNKNGIPIFSVVVSSLLTSILMIMNYSKGLAKAFEFALLLSSMTALIAYLFTSASYLIVAARKDGFASISSLKIIMAIIAFLFAIWAISGSGVEIVYWGFIGLVIGIPFYIWVQVVKNKRDI